MVRGMKSRQPWLQVEATVAAVLRPCNPRVVGSGPTGAHHLTPTAAILITFVALVGR